MRIEIFFSILQRKVLTPNDFPDTEAVKERILRFEQRYNATAQPFQCALFTFVSVSHVRGARIVGRVRHGGDAHAGGQVQGRHIAAVEA